MIATDNGHVRIAGEVTEVLVDLSTAIRAVYTNMVDRAGEDAALEAIAMCGRLAVMYDGELDEEVREKIDEIKSKPPEEVTDQQAAAVEEYERRKG